MTPEAEDNGPDASRGNQRVATISTLICMATTGFLVGWAILGPQEGMETLAIIVPWGIAVLTHVVLSLPALLLAWKTGYRWRNIWIFGYFLVFWGFHAVYFIQSSEMDAAFVRNVHRFSQPADDDLYQLLSRRGARKRSDPPLDPAVKVRALALIEQGADIHYRPPGSRFTVTAM